MRVHRWSPSIGLLVSIAACESPGAENADGEVAGKQAGEQPAAGMEQFELDYTVHGGMDSRGIPEQLASSYPELDLHQCFKWLRVRTAVEGGHSVAIYTGSSVEEFASGDPIGLFYERLDEDGLREVRFAVQWSPWWMQPPLSGRDHYASLHQVHYASSSFSIDRELSPLHGPFKESVERLALEFHERTTDMPKRATLDIEVGVERDRNDPSRHILYASLTNDGVDPIVLTDPRTPRESSRDRVPRFEWRIAKMSSSSSYVAPYEGTSLPIPALPTDAPQSLVLAGGESFELSAPWVAPEPGHYRLRAHWDDYDGPIVPVEAQLPFMPLSDDGQLQLGSGPWPIRGHAYVHFVFEVGAEP